MPSTTFGLAIPQVFVDSPADLREVRDVVVDAEAAGFSTLWVQEQVLGRASTLEPVNLLSVAATLTTRVRLATGVLVLPLHHPVHLAKQLATLDVLSGGRLDVGFGLGRPPAPEFGVPPGRLVRRFTEALDVMEALWSGEFREFHGEAYTLGRDAAIAPLPLQRPRPPLWMGASAESGIRRAVRRADGWLGAGSTSIDEFEAGARILRDELALLGDRAGSFRIAKRVYVLVDEARPRADARLRHWFGEYYGNPDLARVAIAGSWDAIEDAIGRVAEGGADHILLNPVFEHRRHIEVFAERLRLTPPEPEVE